MVTKIIRHNLRNVVIGTAFLACLFLVGASARAAAQTITNGRELKAALKTANTPDDHQRIAAYYEKKAEEFQRRELEERKSLATIPFVPTMVSKTPHEDHKSLAEYYHQAAEKALEKAKEHRTTAETLALRSPLRGASAQP